MGRIKDWLLSNHQCVVCGRYAQPLPEFSTLTTPICSEECKNQYDELMATIEDWWPFDDDNDAVPTSGEHEKSRELR